MDKLTFNGKTEAEGRAAIVAEAMTWIKTPYIPGGRIKGVGCDCGTLIAEVYERAGIIGHMDIEPYAPDFHKHRKNEKYVEYILSQGRIIEPGQAGDVAMWRFGHVRSHGAIISAWPLVIHATFREKIVWPCDVSQDGRYGTQDVQYYSYWG